VTTRARSGFTIVEVLVAVMILGVGVVAMAGSSAMVTRMIGRGKVDTRAAQVATQRVEMLRATAYSTTPRCTALANGGPVTSSGVAVAWTVAVTGGGRTVNVSVSYVTPMGTRTETVTTYIEC
jgi:prepilin-type N-terminal cleavage/methylation domain-containing protein